MTQVRKWGGMFYVSVHCATKDCELRWKSSYFQDRDEAEKYAARIPARARCLMHVVKRAKPVVVPGSLATGESFSGPTAEMVAREISMGAAPAVATGAVIQALMESEEARS